MNKDQPFNSFYIDNKNRLSLNDDKSYKYESQKVNTAEKITTNMSVYDYVDSKKKSQITQNRWSDQKPRPPVIDTQKSEESSQDAKGFEDQKNDQDDSNL